MYCRLKIVYSIAREIHVQSAGASRSQLRTGGSEADFYAGHKRDKKFRIFFFSFSPRGTRRNGIRAEGRRSARVRDRSGGRGNGKSARYYAPLTSGKRRRTISGRERERERLFILLPANQPRRAIL